MITMKWEEIEIYDKLKSKPVHCLFYFKEERDRNGYVTLPPLIEKTRHYGNRECLLFIQYPNVPERYLPSY